MTDSLPTTPPSAAAHPRRSHRRLWISLVVTLGFGVLYLATHIAAHESLRREIETAKGLFVKYQMFLSAQSHLPAMAAPPDRALDEVGAMVRDPDRDLFHLLPLVGSAPMPSPGERLAPQQLIAIQSYLDLNSQALNTDAVILTRDIAQFNKPAASEPAHVTASRKLTRLYALAALEDSHHPHPDRPDHLLTIFMNATDRNRDARLIGLLTDRSNASLIVSLIEYLANSHDATDSEVSFSHSILEALKEDESLSPFDPSPNFGTALCIELALGHNALNESLGSAHAHSPGLSPLQSLWSCNRFALRHHTRHIGYLLAMNKLIGAADAPHHERIARFQAVYDEIQNGPDILYDYAKERITAYPTALHLDMVVEARVRAARAAMLALLYYQSEGHLPASLDDLTQVQRDGGGSWFLNMLTKTQPPLSPPDPDPYTDRPLLYKTLPSGGFTVYSVGEDGVDDGGVRTNEAGQDFGPGADVPFTILQLPSR